MTQDIEKLKREWIEKNGVTKCPPAYLNIEDMAFVYGFGVRNLTEIPKRFLGYQKGGMFGTIRRGYIK